MKNSFPLTKLYALSTIKLEFIEVIKIPENKVNKVSGDNYCSKVKI